MLKSIITILLLLHMVLGFFVWMEDHDNTRLRVIRLGIVVMSAVILLFILSQVDSLKP